MNIKYDNLIEKFVQLLYLSTHPFNSKLQQSTKRCPTVTMENTTTTRVELQEATEGHWATEK